MYGLARHEVVTTEVQPNTVIAATGVNVLGANRVAFEVATFLGTSGVNVSLSVSCCDTLAGTYRPLYSITANSAGSGIVKWEVLQNTGNYIAICDDVVGAKFIKPVLNLTATVTVSVKVHVIY